MTFAISDLRQRSDFFDAVADRIWQAWWRRHGVPLEYIATRLRENLRSSGIPIALVAHRGDDFLGTASLIASDMDERPQYSPWVAAVWTEPEVRGQGIAPALIERAVSEGFALEHDRIYLSAAPPRHAFYEKLGWTPVEAGVGPLDLTIFVRERA